MSRKVGKRSTKPVFTLQQDVAARIEGPQAKKKWSKHDIKPVQPLTQNQKNLFIQYYQGDNICAYGSAGTGKSFLACYLAANDILDPTKDQKKIIIVRSAVQARDQGYLPGTAEEKAAQFENPYKDIFADLFGRSATYDDMKAANLISFETTSCIRGMTWDNAIIIIDEVQNMNFAEINTVMTRVGTDSRVIIAGDVKQNDLTRKSNDVSGMVQMLAALERMGGFSTVQFTRDDIIRSNFVKQWIIACEDVGL